MAKKKERSGPFADLTREDLDDWENNPRGPNICKT